MSGSTDPWSAFPIVQADPPPPADHWSAFPLVERPGRAAPTTGELLGMFARTGGQLADNAVRTLARGASLNLADEIAAAGNAAVGTVTGQPGTFGERYARNLAAERARDAGFDQRNPVLSPVGQMAGGAALPLRIAGGANSMLGAIGRSAGTGAAVGGAAGFGAGEGGAVPRAFNAAEGAVVGGAVGAAIPPAVAGAAALGGVAGRAIGAADRTAPAQRLALRDLERDAVTPAELLRRAEQAGDAPVANVDLAGENFRQAGSAIARMPGEGQRQATELLAQRAGPAQAERLRQNVREIVNADDYGETLARVAQSRREAAAENYERAYSVTLPRDLRLQRFLNDPEVRDGVREGLASARREALAQDRAFDPAEFGIRINRRTLPDGRVVEDFQLVGGNTPTRLFDAAKRGLDRLEEAARGPNGQATSRSREIAQLRHALLVEVDRLNPAYAQARAAYAGDTALLSAANDGRRLVTMRPEDFDMAAADLRRMSESEREFFRLGVARGLMDRINSSADGAEATRLRQMFGTEFMRERLRAIFDNPEDFDRFRRVMDQEISMAQTNRAINPQGGSPTMPLTARREDIATPPRGPVLGSLVGREPGEGGVDLGALLRAQRFGGTDYTAQVLQQQLGRQRSASALERNASDYARILFANNQDERVRMARALLEREVSEGARSRLSASLAQSLMRGAGVYGGQTDVLPVPQTMGR